MFLTIIGFLALLALGAMLLCRGIYLLLAAPALQFFGISQKVTYSMGSVATAAGLATVYYAFCLLPYTIHFTGA